MILLYWVGLLSYPPHNIIRPKCGQVNLSCICCFLLLHVACEGCVLFSDSTDKCFAERGLISHWKCGECRGKEAWHECMWAALRLLVWASTKMPGNVPPPCGLFLSGIYGIPLFSPLWCPGWQCLLVWSFSLSCQCLCTGQAICDRTQSCFLWDLSYRNVLTTT